MSAPAIGTFIRPVGSTYSYCFEVVKVIAKDKEGPEQWHCKRWGKSAEHQPMADGHHDIHYLNNLQEVLPGVWRGEWLPDTPRWGCCPLYYKKVETKGQQDLFI